MKEARRRSPRVPKHSEPFEADNSKSSRRSKSATREEPRQSPKEAKVILRHVEPKVMMQPSSETVSTEMEDGLYANSTVLCHMEFTTDEENCPNDVTDDLMDGSGTQNLSENQDINFPLCHETSDKDVGSSSSELVNLITPDSLHMNDIDASTSFPIITKVADQASVQGADSDMSPCIESYSTITSRISANDANQTCSQSASKQMSSTDESKSKFLTSIAQKLIQKDNYDNDDDDEIQVVKETCNKKSWGDAILKNAPIAKTLCKLLLAEPLIRSHLQMFQTLAMESYRAMSLELNSGRLDNNEYKRFQVISEKLINQLEHHKARNKELEKEVKSLREEFEVKEEQKDNLKESVTKSVLEKMKEKKDHEIQGLEEKIAQVRAEIEIILQEGREKSRKLKESVVEMEQKDKEIVMYKQEIEELKMKICVPKLEQSAQTKFPKDTDFPNLNETCIGPQQPSVPTVQKNEMFFMQQRNLSSVPSSASMIYE